MRKRILTLSIIMVLLTVTFSTNHLAKGHSHTYRPANTVGCDFYLLESLEDAHPHARLMLLRVVNEFISTGLLQECLDPSICFSHGQSIGCITVPFLNQLNICIQEYFVEGTKFEVRTSVFPTLTYDITIYAPDGSVAATIVEDGVIMREVAPRNCRVFRCIGSPFYLEDISISPTYDGYYNLSLTHLSRCVNCGERVNTITNYLYNLTYDMISLD